MSLDDSNPDPFSARWLIVVQHDGQNEWDNLLD